MISGDRLYEQKQNHLGGPSLQDNGFSKDWQDGLRALLPNVNVSFGLNSQAPGPGGPHGHNNTGHFGLGNMHQPSFSQHQER